MNSISPFKVQCLVTRIFVKHSQFEKGDAINCFISFLIQESIYSKYIICHELLKGRPPFLHHVYEQYILAFVAVEFSVGNSLLFRH